MSIEDIINLRKRYSVYIYSQKNDRVLKSYLTAYTSLFTYPDIIYNINRSIDSAVNSLTGITNSLSKRISDNYNQIKKLYDRIKGDENNISDLMSKYNSLKSDINNLSDKIKSNLNQINKNKDNIDHLLSMYNSMYSDVNNLKSEYNNLLQFKNKLQSSNMHTYIHNIYTQVKSIRSVIDKQLNDIKNAYNSIHISMTDNLQSVVSDIKSQLKNIEKIPFNLDINYYSLFNMYSVENALNSINIPDFTFNPKVMNDFMGIVSTSTSKVNVTIVDVSYSKSWTKSGVVNPSFWLYYYLTEAMYNRLNKSVTFAKNGDLVGMAKSIWLAMVSMKVFGDLILHINAGNSKFEKVYYFPLDNRVYLYVYADNLRFIYPYKSAVNEIENLSKEINSKVTRYIKDLRNATLKIPKSIPTKVNLRKDIYTGIDSNKIRDVSLEVQIQKQSMVIENLSNYIKQLEDRIAQLENKLKEVGL